MMQLPLSVLPGAGPTTETAGLAGGTSATTAEGGDGASVFASLLTAMQTAPSDETVAADALDLTLTEGDGTESTTGETDGEIPTGLTALVQSLIVPQVATTSAGEDGDQVPTDPATPPVAPAVTTTPLGPLGESAAPSAPLPTAATATSALTASAPAPAATPATELPVEVETDTAIAVQPPPIPTTAASTGTATELDLTVEAPEQATAEGTPLHDVDTAEAEPTEAGLRTSPADTDPAPDAAVDDASPDTLISDTTTSLDDTADTRADDAAGDPPAETPAREQQADQSQAGQTALRQDTGELSNQSAPVGTVAPEARTAPAAANGVDQIRPAEATRPSGAPITGIEANATATAAAVTESAPTNVERADAPVTIERITLREMPTVVVDRIRAIDPQGGVNRAVVRLDPPELGRILLEVVSNGDEIAVIARADSAEAVRALVRQRAEIEAAIEALGMSISDFDVKQDDGERQDAQPEAHRDRSYDERRPAGETGYATTDTTATEGELFL